MNPITQNCTPLQVSAIRKLLALFLVVLFLGACSSEAPQPPIRLGVPVSTQASLPWLTQELGLFRKNGVRIELVSYPSGKRAPQALLKGRLDLAVSAETPFAIAAFDHPDLRLFSTLGKSDDEIRVLARRDHGIEKPADLAGKSIATQQNSAVHFFLSSFLLYHGLDPKGIDLHFMKAEELAPALVSGEVDAISMRDPILEEAKWGLGEGRWVEMKVPGLYTKTYNLLGRVDFLQKHPGTMERILQALMEAEEYLEQHPEQARKLIAARLGLTETRLEQLWSGLQFRVSLSQGLLATLQEEAAWAVASGAVDAAKATAMPDFLVLLELRPLSSVAPDTVGLIGLEPGK